MADPKRNEVYYQAGEALGFWWFEIVGNELLGVLYDSEGGVLFEQGHPPVE